MNQLLRTMLNLNYVRVDRAEARADWNRLAEAAVLDPYFFYVNRTALLRQKAVAGILSHRQTRGFIVLRIRERGVRRRLAQA